MNVCILFISHLQITLIKSRSKKVIILILKSFVKMKKKTTLLHLFTVLIWRLKKNKLWSII